MAILDLLFAPGAADLAFEVEGGEKMKVISEAVLSSKRANADLSQSLWRGWSIKMMEISVKNLF